MSSDTGVVISRDAQTLATALRSAGILCPTRDNYLDYRLSVRNGFQPYIDAAMAEFRGDISHVQVGDIDCLQLTPEDWSEHDGICIQYAYGGGYVSGSVEEDLIITAPLAMQANARVMSVNYQLSPEHPYPKPQDDFAAAYAELLAQYGSSRLVLSGESAGGNQVLGLLQRIRKQRLDMPVCAVLFSPWIDLSHSGDSHKFNDNRDPSLNMEWVEYAAEMHSGGHPLDHPGISPLFGEVTGLPPTMITTGSRELLLSDSLRLARKLVDAGVECELRVWEGMWHVFEFYPIPEAAASISEVAGFIRRHCQA